MAVQAQQRPEVNTLSTLVQGWDRRLRIKQIMTWLPRSLAPGLFMGVVLALVSRITPLLTNTQVLLVGMGGALLGLFLMLIVILFRRRSTLDSARRFDLTFHLKETISTALELNSGRIHADDLMQDYQIQDAVNRANRVDVKQDLPIEINRREWLGVALLIIALTIGVILPNQQADALIQDNTDNAIVQGAEEEISEIIEDIATNPAIDEELREQLLETLQVNLDTLQNEDITAEEALATLNDVQSLLEEQAERLQNEQEIQDEALQAALESLREQLNLQNEGNQGENANEQLSEALNEIARGLENGEMNPAQAGEALQDAAEQLEATNPELAQQLDQASQELQNGESQNGQPETSQTLNELAQQMQTNLTGQAQQSLEQSASEVGESIQQMTQSGNQQQQQSGDSQQPGNSQQPGDSQQPGQGNEGDSENQGGGQEGEGEGSGEQSAENQQGGGGNGESGDEQSQGQDGEGGANSNQGQPGPGGNQPGTNTGDTSGSDAQANGEGTDETDGGVGQFEQIFDPRSVGEVGDTDIVLQPDEGDIPVQQGEFTPNDVGNVTVPYNEVFSDYSNAANEALQRGYVPLGLRDIVRDYFTSLEPSNNGGDN